jgi:hypothetical protein
LSDDAALEERKEGLRGAHVAEQIDVELPLKQRHWKVLGRPLKRHAGAVDDADQRISVPPEQSKVNEWVVYGWVKKKKMSENGPQNGQNSKKNRENISYFFFFSALVTGNSSRGGIDRVVRGDVDFDGGFKGRFLGINLINRLLQIAAENHVETSLSQSLGRHAAHARVAACHKN